MTFADPILLLCLLIVPAAFVVYGQVQRRRSRYVVRFTNVDLLKTRAPKGLGYRRHLAAGAFLLCLLTLASAMARPSMDAKQPLERATVMIAIDVSLSMRSEVARSLTYASERASGCAGLERKIR